MSEMNFVMPKGFLAGGGVAGIKQSGTEDLAVIYSESPATGAAVFTRNAFAAAPVLYSKNVISGNPHGLRAVVVNSGNANACTGDRGLEDAGTMARLTAESLGIPENSVFVMSTGIIGVPLPMEKLEEGIPEVCRALSPDGLEAAARAMMTTDTRPKFASTWVRIDEKEVLVSGVAKGAGMIHPDMATMLAVIVTDASVSTDALERALRWAVDQSFNSISVDGDTSTNDTVLAMANGRAGNETITCESDDFLPFADAILEVAASLARQIVEDGEGATKFVTISVRGAMRREDARKVGKAIANSSLVKTALFGGDPNWGRILAAAGYAGVALSPEKVSLRVASGTEENHGESLLLVSGGQPVDFDSARAAEIFASPRILIDLDLGLGLDSATVWTCDLSHEYVDINGYYHT